MAATQHFYKVGSFRPFAAVCPKVYFDFVDKTAINLNGFKQSTGQYILERGTHFALARDKRIETVGGAKLRGYSLMIITKWLLWTTT